MIEVKKHLESQKLPLPTERLDQLNREYENKFANVYHGMDILRRVKWIGGAGGGLDGLVGFEPGAEAGAGGGASGRSGARR